MSAPIGAQNWWELHLRKARGEALTEQELQQYEAQVARQDREVPPLTVDLDELTVDKKAVCRSHEVQVSGVASRNDGLTECHGLGHRQAEPF